MIPVGRLLVRADKTAGLFIPYNKGSLLYTGIYELTEILGEICVRRVGVPAMPNAKYQGLSVEELLGDPTAGMTVEELATVTERIKPTKSKKVRK